MKNPARPPKHDLKRDLLTGEIKVAKISGSFDTITLSGPDFGPIVLNVEQVAVASARTGMPGLIRASAKSGRAFLIQNAKNPSAASALLINPDVLQKRLAQARPTRTLGQLLDSLPFKRRGAPRLTAEMPDDVAPEKVPTRAEPLSAEMVAPPNRRKRSEGELA